MEPTKEAYEMIKRFESFSPRACKAIKEEKYYSIGYGHYSPTVKKTDRVTQEEAERLLYEDVAKYSRQLAESCPRLTQRQYDALVSLIYNIGWDNFRHSMTFIKCHNLGVSALPSEAAARIILWVRAAGRVLPGLQRRRVAEANYFLGYEKYKVIDGQIVEI